MAKILGIAILFAATFCGLLWLACDKKDDGRGSDWVEEYTKDMHEILQPNTVIKWEVRRMNVSAFCPNKCCCGKFADGITASGHRIRPGDKFVAADKRYAFGTMMEIPGYGKVPVLDRGGAIKGDKIDLYFPTHAEALQFGRQYLEVTIIEKKEKPNESTKP